MRLAVGSDERTHVTEAVVADLRARGHEIELFGPLLIESADSWPLVAQNVAERVASGGCEGGILFCWTGTGVSIAANKVSGVRAALCTDAETAAGARKWNDANVLCLSLRLTSEVVAREILDAWFGAEVDESERENIERMNAQDRSSSYRFCPKCAGELVSAPDGDGHQRLVCQRCSFVFYRNSKPCASALVVRDGKVLLVKRAVNPYKDWWDIPGGFLEQGEHPEEGARRELREETGFGVRITELLGIFMDDYVYGAQGEHTLNLFYLAEEAGRTPRPGSDAASLAWFGRDEIPERVAFKCCREALAALEGSGVGRPYGTGRTNLAAGAC